MNKILQINSVCGIRSTGRICTDIAKILSNKGDICKIAYGRESVPSEYEKYAVRIGTETNIKVNALKARIFDNEGFNAIKQTVKLVDYLKEYKPDIVHLHNLHGYYLNLEILLSYLAKEEIPIIWTLHDCWAFTGHCVHFSLAKCKKWHSGCHDCTEKKSYPSSFFRDNSHNNFQKKKEIISNIKKMTVVTPSFWLRDLVNESFLSKYPVRVIPNGIDTDVFKPTESDFRKKNGLENKAIILGVASAWGKGKGLDDFIKMAGLLGNNYLIVLVGLTERQRDALPKGILGITRTNNIKELASIYTASDVFVNPTYQDNYPTTNLEARACGTPVITYRTGGSPESAGEDAIVVDVGNVEGLVSGVKEVTNSERCVCNYKVFEENRKNFSCQAMAEKYVDLYEKMIATHT